ncbi:hypothetical protein M409DRAFT_28737 [Zasmidium cellare ATCC 36951]|uniref:IBR domain-containing protein n=1 Tax=Zasmidium cellare ATCC 36951 TaxID=1080233 RepID=A0A6A6C1C5_ZASCE|nr:uncharacterized protein M409DRAFT_28737 [Zasmidium cellare ATCC 36951]KAF2160857.1 hypothetical protein M409DRAFT_28737 [Zasmidium cellare ATCC 36951]
MSNSVVDSAINIIEQVQPPAHGSAYIRLSQGLKRFMAFAFPQRRPPKLYQCSYCYEDKPAKAFKYPFFCNVHLPRACVKKLKNDKVCYECLCTAVAAQLDLRPASAMGCPDCNLTWTTPDVYYLLPYEKRDVYATKLKEEMSYVLSHPTNKNATLTIDHSVQPYSPPPRETLNILISQRTRLCPFCGAAVQKRSGCYGVICGQCHRAFPYDRARSLQMVHHEWVIETHQRNYALANRNDSRSWVGTHGLTD